MEWTLPIVFVVGYFIYTFTKERKEMVDIQVTARGGMKKKYSEFTKYIQEKAKFEVIDERSDELLLSVAARGSKINIHFVEMLNEVEVELIANLHLKGTHRKKWKYPDGYDQKLMANEVDNYFNWLGSQV